MALWRQPLNPLLGDAGFGALHGRSPGPDDAEEERIKAHLLLVVKRLRAGGLPKRCECAEVLERYAAAGEFPKHRDTPKARSPIFVDHRGTACAVGYLMRCSGAADLCRDVDSAHHFGLVGDILAEADPKLVQRLLAWADDQGLTAEDLAVIQPGYTASAQVTFLLLMALAVGGSAACAVMEGFGVALAFMDSWRSAPEIVLAALGAFHLLLAVLILQQLTCQERASWAEILLKVVSCFTMLALPADVVLLAFVTRKPELWDGRADAQKSVVLAAWGLVAAVFLGAAGFSCFGAVQVFRNPSVVQRHVPPEEDTEDAPEQSD